MEKVPWRRACTCEINELVREHIEQNPEVDAGETGGSKRKRGLVRPQRQRGSALLRARGARPLENQNAKRAPMALSVFAGERDRDPQWAETTSARASDAR